MSVTRLGHVGLVVRDLDRYARFLTDGLGLREIDRRDGVARFALNSRHHQVRVTEGEVPGCDGLGFDVSDRAALDGFRSRVEQAGFEITRDTPVDDAVDAGFSFRIPAGPTVELCVGASQAPPAGEGNDPYRLGFGSPTKIRKLGHVTMASEDPFALEQHFVEVLGFRVSDRFPGVLSWARCNGDHHAVGFAQAAGPGVHHMAYEIESFAHLEAFLDRLAERGTRLMWGPGRHGPGNNIFVYLEDPEGNLVEVYTDLVQIPNEHDYVAGDWTDLQEVGNSWGPLPEQAWFEKLTPYAAPVGAR
jgi:catechol 2,3-dioxygenase